MTENAGLLNIYKPSGVTSYWVVRQVKRALGIKKVGHCGTLDPLAEGVLLVVFGAATRLSAQMMNAAKVYRARLRLGVVTDSGDITGRVLEERVAAAVTRAAVDAVLPRFTGMIEQIPPMYSALKQKGRKLYELARKGITVERAPRQVTVYSLDVLGLNVPALELRIGCSRGTYIRTLAEDIGAALGCGATIDYLCRERVGGFSSSDGIPGTALKDLSRDELFARSYTVEHIKGLYA